MATTSEKPGEAGVKCPNCGQDAEADFVDIGVGEQRVSPWGCPHCHWIENTSVDEFIDDFDWDSDPFGKPVGKEQL
jgi:ssDNA-binding Zn-finger/Zn-ribbon topoisomerase 1